MSLPLSAGLSLQDVEAVRRRLVVGRLGADDDGALLDVHDLAAGVDAEVLVLGLGAQVGRGLVGAGEDPLGLRVDEVVRARRRAEVARALRREADGVVLATAPAPDPACDPPVTFASVGAGRQLLSRTLGSQS